MDANDRTPDQQEQMIHAAHASFYHWTSREDCSSLNLSVGAWQLSRVYCLAAEAPRALHYALKCLSYSQDEGPFFLGYAYETQARALLLIPQYEQAKSKLQEAQRLCSLIEEQQDRELLQADLDQLQQQLEAVKE